MEVGNIFVGGYSGAAAGDVLSPKQKLTENFTVDDILDFSNEDATISDGFIDNVAANSTDSSTVTSGGDNHFSSSDLPHSSQFSGELCVPFLVVGSMDDVVEITHDIIFPTEQNLQSNLQISATSKSPTPESSSSTRSDTNLIFQNNIPLPAKARSKRSRAAPWDWSTRVFHPVLKRELSGRKCLHCAAEKTPQWRRGPMGPKTLCNACGVRYKSGRLVPEYRPAWSPTFVWTKHSNSHKKVLELRRQKDLQRAQYQLFLNQITISGISNGGGGADDFFDSSPPF